MKRTTRRVSHLWRVLTRRDRITADMDDEMRFHVEMDSVRRCAACALRQWTPCARKPDRTAPPFNLGDRMLMFGDWLRVKPEDRQLYARTKSARGLEQIA